MRHIFKWFLLQGYDSKIRIFYLKTKNHALLFFKYGSVDAL